MNTSDLQLIANYQTSGSRDDLEELVGRHIGSVRNLAYRLVLCESSADDVTQEVFMKAIRNLKSFRGDAQFPTWLYSITVNTASTYLRKQATRREISDPEAVKLVTRSASPDQRTLQTELAGDIEQALGRLPVKLRTAIVLTGIEELPVSEAAMIEGCNIGTMYWRVHRARKLLKQFLDKQLYS